MWCIKHINVVGLSVCLLTTGCDRQQVNALQEQAEAITSKYTICFTVPSKQILNRNSGDEPLGNAFTGVGLRFII